MAPSLRVQSTRAGKALRQEQEPAAHGREAEEEDCWCAAACFLLFQPRIPARGMVRCAYGLGGSLLQLILPGNTLTDVPRGVMSEWLKIQSS